MNSEDLWGALVAAIGGFAVAYLYLLAYLKPDRNKATRFIIDYVGRWSMFRTSDHRYETLAIGLTMLAVGILGLFFVIKELFRLLL
jgi:hypothetical protein